MNDYDWENLQFLLNASEDTLRDWYSSVSADDIQYASELLAQHSEELAIKSKFYATEEVDLTNFTPDASEYLKKFTIGKK